MRRRIDPIDRYDDFPRPAGIQYGGIMDNVTADQTTGAARARPRPRRSMTPAQERRHARNTLICLAAANGYPQRRIAMVFGLPRSRVAAIVKEYREQSRKERQMSKRHYAPSPEQIQAGPAAGARTPPPVSGGRRTPEMPVLSDMVKPVAEIFSGRGCCQSVRTPCRLA